MVVSTKMDIRMHLAGMRSTTRMEIGTMVIGLIKIGMKDLGTKGLGTKDPGINLTTTRMIGTTTIGQIMKKRNTAIFHSKTMTRLNISTIIVSSGQQKKLLIMWIHLSRPIVRNTHKRSVTSRLPEPLYPKPVLHEDSSPL